MTYEGAIGYLSQCGKGRQPLRSAVFRDFWTARPLCRLLDCMVARARFFQNIHDIQHEEQGKPWAERCLREPRAESPAIPQPRAPPWVSMRAMGAPGKGKSLSRLCTFSLSRRIQRDRLNPGRCTGLGNCWASSPQRLTRCKSAT